MIPDSHWFEVYIAQTEYTFGRKRPRPRLKFFLRQLSMIPSYPIRIEKIGGGASPEGFAAFVWPDEMHMVALMKQRLDNWTDPVEAWTEEGCFALAYRALIRNTLHRLGEPWLMDFPTFNVSDKADFSLFLEPWQRVELLHDIDDCCLAIDSSGLLH